MLVSKSYTLVEQDSEAKRITGEDLINYKKFQETQIDRKNTKQRCNTRSWIEPIEIEILNIEPTICRRKTDHSQA